MIRASRLIVVVATLGGIAIGSLGGCSVGDDLSNVNKTTTVRLEMTDDDDEVTKRVKRYRITVTPEGASEIVVFHDPKLNDDAMVADVPAGLVDFRIEGFECLAASPTPCPNEGEEPIIFGEDTVSVPLDGNIEPIQIVMQVPSEPVIWQAPIIHSMDVSRPQVGPHYVVREQIAIEVIFSDDAATDASTIVWEASAGSVEPVPDQPHKVVWTAPNTIGKGLSVTATVTDATGLQTKGQRVFSIFDTPSSILFSTYGGKPLRWSIKTECNGPGPNCWSKGLDAVSVNDGKLRLTITQGHEPPPERPDKDGKDTRSEAEKQGWRSAEVFTRTKFGYGQYQYVVEFDPSDDNSEQNGIDNQAVLGLFSHSEIDTSTPPDKIADELRELDIELTAAFGLGDPPDKGQDERRFGNAHWTVQGPDPRGKFQPNNNEDFSFKQPGATTTHMYTWGPGWVTFEAHDGDITGGPKPNGKPMQGPWTYCDFGIDPTTVPNGCDNTDIAEGNSPVPVPKDETVNINLFSFNFNKVKGVDFDPEPLGRTLSATIHNFVYRPLFPDYPLLFEEQFAEGFKSSSRWDASISELVRHWPPEQALVTSILIKSIPAEDTDDPNTERDETIPVPASREHSVIVSSEPIPRATVDPESGEDAQRSLLLRAEINEFTASGELSNGTSEVRILIGIVSDETFFPQRKFVPFFAQSALLLFVEADFVDDGGKSKLDKLYLVVSSKANDQDCTPEIGPCTLISSVDSVLMREEIVDSEGRSAGSMSDLFPLFVELSMDDWQVQMRAYNRHYDKLDLTGSGVAVHNIHGALDNERVLFGSEALIDSADNGDGGQATVQQISVLDGPPIPAPPNLNLSRQWTEIFARGFRKSSDWIDRDEFVVVREGEAGQAFLLNLPSHDQPSMIVRQQKSPVPDAKSIVIRKRINRFVAEGSIYDDKTEARAFLGLVSEQARNDNPDHQFSLYFSKSALVAYVEGDFVLDGENPKLSNIRFVVSGKEDGTVIDGSRPDCTSEVECNIISANQNRFIGPLAIKTDELALKGGDLESLFPIYVDLWVDDDEFELRAYDRSFARLPLTGGEGASRASFDAKERFGKNGRVVFGGEGRKDAPHNEATSRGQGTAGLVFVETLQVLTGPSLP